MKPRLVPAGNCTGYTFTPVNSPGPPPPKPPGLGGVANPPSRRCEIVAALLGAPNVGKTTLFNALTGAKELVANWPGATVEVKYAELRLDGKRVCLVDLPGLYSLSGSGPEEGVARDFILEQKPDVLIVLADATNLERSLYLPLEALELYDKVIVALTKIDAAEKAGVKIDVEGLQRSLGVPVVAVSALQGRGLDELKKLILDVAEGRVKPRSRVEPPVPRQLAERHERLSWLLQRHGVEERLARWLALQLLAGSDWAWRLAERLAGRDTVEEAKRIVEGVDPSEAAAAIAAERYNRAAELFRRHVRCPEGGGGEPLTAPRLTRLDMVFLHPVAGPLASLALLFAIFLASYAIAAGSPVDIILESLGFTRAAELVAEYNLVSLTAAAMDWLAEKAMEAIPHPVLARLIGEGVLSSGYGVGLVVSFLPMVAVFMALVAVLEDSGLVPRIAAGVDRMFRVFGVSGKAVFPALLSFGCNVPAVLSTRIMDTERERRAMMYAIPLIPCTARYVVIMSFAYAYFAGAKAALVAFTVYMIAIAAFLLTLRLYSRGPLAAPEEEEEEAEILLELPPLKKPSLRVVWWLTWDKVKHFLVRAGTVILVASILLWLAANYGPAGYLGEEGSPADSYAAMIGRLLAPYAKLISGVDDELAWRIGFGLLGGFIAKEVFLDSLAIVAPAAGAEEAEHVEVLASYPLTPWQALALLVAVTLYIPCLATMATIYAETGDRKLPIKVAAYTIALATAAALTVRALGSIAA